MQCSSVRTVVRRWFAIAGVLALLATFGTVTTSGNIFSGTAAADPDCAAVVAVSASATGDDGNVPGNAIDGNLGTRWSAAPTPQAITVDYGSVAELCSVSIAWFHGDERANTFTVAVSSDGTGFTSVFTGSSSGTTDQLENYVFSAPSNGRYLRVTVSDSTGSEWASISEIVANPQQPEPPDPPGSGFDPNGVAQIYESQTGRAEPWTLGFGAWQDRFDLDGSSISGTGKDTVLRNNGSPRMDVFATEAVVNCLGNEDYAVNLAQGYACSPDDWNNLEMTGYLRVLSEAGDSDDQDWTMYGPSGTHTDNGQYPQKCWGHSYKGSYHYSNAEVRFGKETWHVNYDYGGPAQGWTPVPGGIDYSQNPDKWLGMKFIRYHFMRNGQEGIRAELWLDLDGIDAAGNPANNWHLAQSVEDHPDGPSWGEGATDCNAPNDDQILLWGNPRATFRWDDAESELRLASVREIQPPQ